MKGRFDHLFKAFDSEELSRACHWLLKSEADLSRIEAIDFTPDSIDRFDDLRTQRALKKIGRPDLLIACIALAHRATLVTRNLKDFKLVPGLRCENWAD